MKNYLIVILFVLAGFLFSCKEDLQPQPLPVDELKEFDVSGNAQKGPFISGSRVTIYELTHQFKPTGRTFDVYTDEKGHFELNDVKLISPNIEILADGYYYNEITGDLSNERIMLKAIVTLSDQTNLNVNVLTHMECERIKYLMEVKTLDFQAAKQQAKKELLKVFNMDEVEIEDAEFLDIANSGKGDAVLLAISAILQGNRTTAELSKLQADMIADMKKDGILNDTLIQSALISHSRILNIDQIGKNVVSKFNELGLALDQVNDFSQYIENFNLHSAYHFSFPFEFPASIETRPNLLGLKVLKVNANAEYAFAVKMPSTGNLKIRLKLLYGTTPWNYQPFLNNGWQVSQFDFSKNTQVFTSTSNNGLINLPISFPGFGAALVEYYFNDSAIPSQSKTITWGPETSSSFEFKNSIMGLNLLAIPTDCSISNDTTYVIGIYSDKEYDKKCKLKYPSTIHCEVLGGYGNFSNVLTSSYLEVFLKSTVFPGTELVGGISEVVLKFTGTGIITIESNLMQLNGQYISKTFTITD